MNRCRQGSLSSGSLVTTRHKTPDTRHALTQSEYGNNFVLLLMKEGFDVGLEMSGSAEAFRGVLANMFHGGKITMLGIQKSNAAIDWNQVIFNGLTIKGIYGREMYETWYKMTSMIQTGLDISPVITHRFRYQLFEEGFEVMRSGKSGKVILDWID